MASQQQDSAGLEAQVAELTAELERLRAQSAPAGKVVPPAKHRWRAVVSALCILLASILLVLSVVAGWSRTLLVDEDRFVQTLAPLATEPAVQQAVTNHVSEAITSAVDLEQITDDLLDGLESIGIPPRAVDALDLLRGPAREGLQSLVKSTTAELVSSEAFVTVWAQALRASHRALVVAATGGTAAGALTIDDSGTVSVNLAPVIESVKKELTARGMDFAAAIPEIETDIVIAQSDALVTISLVYGLAITVGNWLPVITVLLFAGGVAFARRRSTALLGTGVGIAVSAIILQIAFSIGQSVLAASAAAHGISASVVTAVYQQTTGAMTTTATVLIVVGIVLAAIGWLSGRWAPARSVRSFAHRAYRSVRSHPVTT